MARSTIGAGQPAAGQGCMVADCPGLPTDRLATRLQVRLAVVRTDVVPRPEVRRRAGYRRQGPLGARPNAAPAATRAGLDVGESRRGEFRGSRQVPGGVPKRGSRLRGNESTQI